MTNTSAQPHQSARRLALACVLLTSCATYADRTAVALRAFENGDFAAAGEQFADREVTGSSFLSGVETGTVAMTDGHWDAALEHLHSAGEVVKELEDRALVSATDLGESVLSWTVNDTVKEYQGEGYERVMMHACLGFCYLALGKLDDVWVEARLANKLLETEEKLYEKKYAAGGLGHFLSALAYELLDRPDEAYIDYKRMVEKGVGVELAGKALVRLSRELSFQDEYERWVEQFGDAPPRDPDAAMVVIIGGVGLGPFKEEARIDLPTGNGIYSWAIPVLTPRPQRVRTLSFSIAGGDQAVNTSVIENVAHVAKENLDDRIAWLAAKSAVRGLFKQQVTKRLEEEHGAAGWIIGSLWSLSTERADLRGWNTLPDTWQAARVFLAPGEHDMTLEAVGGERRHLGVYQLDPGETMFLLARTIAGRLYVHPIGGQPMGDQLGVDDLGEYVEPFPESPSEPVQP